MMSTIYYYDIQIDMLVLVGMLRNIQVCICNLAHLALYNDNR